MKQRTRSPFWHPHGHWCGFFTDHTYAFQVHLIWGVTHKQWGQFVRKYFGDEREDRADDWAGRCEEYTKGQSEVQVVALKRWTGSAYDHSVLVHECMHLVHNVLSSRGLKLTDDGVEAYCYLLDSIYARCLAEIAAAKKLRRKKK